MMWYKGDHYSYMIVLQNVTVSLNQMLCVNLGNKANIREISLPDSSVFTVSKENVFFQGTGPRHVLLSVQRKSHIKSVSMH